MNEQHRKEREQERQRKKSWIEVSIPKERISAFVLGDYIANSCEYCTEAQEHIYRRTNYISKHHSDIYVVRWYKIRCQDNGQTELSISVFTGTQETHAALIKMYTHTHSRIFWSHLPNSFEIKVSISIPLNEFSEATNADFELSNVGSGRPTNFQLSLTA